MRAILLGLMLTLALIPPGTGAIPSDCVGAHSDYKAVFPYLGDPHQ